MPSLSLKPTNGSKRKPATPAFQPTEMDQIEERARKLGRRDKDWIPCWKECFLPSTNERAEQNLEI